jgi:hydrogenase maturation protease
VLEKNKYILGLGNYAKNDDGIGLRIIEYIVDNNLDDGFEAVEIGNDGLNLLTYFNESTEKILIVDCALMGKEPGDSLVFNYEDIKTKKEVGKYINS